MAFKLFVIILCIIKVSQHESDADVSVNTDKNTCEATYEQCSLKLAGSRCPTGGVGYKGDSGKRGIKGTQGPPGQPGLPGRAGVCTHTDSRKPERFLQDLSTDKSFISPDNRTLCIRYDLINITHSFLEQAVHYVDMTHSFWYSQQAFKPDVFYGLSMEELQYISDSSTIVTQIIRYYCRNSFNKRTNYDDHIRFLSWNNILVGSEPSDFSPASYIIRGIDGCKDAREFEDWKYTDIEITGTVSLRLPILDIQIRDVRGEDQYFLVKPLQLCFSKHI